MSDFLAPYDGSRHLSCLQSRPDAPEIPGAGLEGGLGDRKKQREAIFAECVCVGGECEGVISCSKRFQPLFHPETHSWDTVLVVTLSCRDAIP